MTTTRYTLWVKSASATHAQECVLGVFGHTGALRPGQDTNARAHPNEYVIDIMLDNQGEKRLYTWFGYNISTLLYFVRNTSVAEVQAALGADPTAKPDSYGNTCQAEIVQVDEDECDHPAVASGECTECGVRCTLAGDDETGTCHDLDCPVHGV